MCEFEAAEYFIVAQFGRWAGEEARFCGVITQLGRGVNESQKSKRKSQKAKVKTKRGWCCAGCSP
jgi:hypothetical protein